MQPPKQKKPPTMKKKVEPNKRKPAWETTEEEGKTTIPHQHVHIFFIDLNTKH
jgi:hypothetical protein